MPVEVEVGIGPGWELGYRFGRSTQEGGRAKRFIESRDGHKFLGHRSPWSL